MIRIVVYDNRLVGRCSAKVDASKQLLKTRLCILYLEGKCKYGKK